MKTLQDVHANDANLRANSQLTEEMFRNTLRGAVPIFREMQIRQAFPTVVTNDPGVTKSRHIKIVDLSDAAHGMSGTGGTFDRAAMDPEDVIAYAINKNISIPWREGLSMQRGGFDVLRESGQAAGEKVVVAENTMLLNGLGPTTGFTAASGRQTMTGGNWNTGGEGYDDIIEAVFDKLPTKNVPGTQPSLLVHPSNHARLFKKHSSTSVSQIQEIREILGGRIFRHTSVATDKAFVYDRTPTVLEYRVYQDLTGVPLPKIDEDERMRFRVIGALHLKRTDGIVEIQGVDSA